MSRSRLTRRRFVLQGGLALGAAGLAPRRARAGGSSDVIVVGAGLSGLNAALTLQGEGARVTVLEGSQRVGGRVHTADGVPTRPEYGANEVGRSYARVLDVVRRLGLGLEPEDRSLMPFAAHLGGRWVRSREWASSDLNPLPERLRNTPPPRVGTALLGEFNRLQSVSDWLDPANAALDVSIGELLRKAGHSEAVLHLAALTSPSIEGVSALAMLQEANRSRIDAGFGPPQRPGPGAQTLSAASSIRGGTSRLVEAMNHALHRPAQLGRVVGRIDMSGSRVVVECLDGSSYAADFCIAAIPFSQLRHMDVRPGFEGLQAEAIQTLPMLNTTRAYLSIREPFWERDGLDPSFLSDGAIEMFWVIDNHQGHGAYRGLMVLTGDRASRLDALPPTDVPRLLLTELARIRPASAGKVDIHSWNSWAASPLIRCCRHMYGPGQIQRLARPMIVPWQRLHLAGEHTRRNDFGMEAAMESGERAALEVLTA